MSIKVFGASGFIGKNLLIAMPEAIGISVRDSRWKDMLSDDAVYINLIGKAHDHQKTATIEDYNHANVECLKELYSEFVKSTATLFIHVSSIAALEETESLTPLLEGAPCNSTSWYGQSKRTAEIWLLDQSIPDGKTVIILRPPMVHGPGDKGNLGLLYRMISRGIPYPLSSFNNRRSFISIGNFCFFIQQVIAKHSSLLSGIYHIADDETVATSEIINIIKKATNRNVLNIALPKSFVTLIAKLGDFIPIPLNTIRLKKMTSDLIVSNTKIKTALRIIELPQSAVEGLEKTIRSFA